VNNPNISHASHISFHDGDPGMSGTAHPVNGEKLPIDFAILPDGRYRKHGQIRLTGLQPHQAITHAVLWADGGSKYIGCTELTGDLTASEDGEWELAFLDVWPRATERQGAGQRLWQALTGRSL
jgi:hypothetical protein